MTAPEPRPGIESKLTDAFSRRHAEQRPSLPSLVDVRRRANRQSARRATMRAGAVIAAGVTAVAGGWAASRGSSEPSAVLAVPADQAAPPGTYSGVAVTTLSVEGLWAAVAADLGTTVDELRALNPWVDFEAAPAPGGSIAFPSGSETVPETFVRTLPNTTTEQATAPPNTAVQTETTVTMLGGWTVHQVVVGDYLAQIAEDYCTTMEELVAANAWPDVNVSIFPGDLIVVPADAC